MTPEVVRLRPGALPRPVLRGIPISGALALVCALSVLGSGRAGAVGLGPITQQSGLGQSLRVVIPVILSSGEEVAAECVKLVAGDRDVDGIPQVLFGRVGIERTPSGVQLLVTSPRPVNDPLVKVTIQAGCDTSVRREYVLLMDPPIETPLVAADSAAPAETESPPAIRPQPAAGEASGAATRAARAATRAAAAGAGTEQRAAQGTAPAKPRAAKKAVPRRPPPPAAEKPRLKVSSSMPAAAGTRPATGAEQARAQQELANALEAETVVLRQRIVELTAMVERVQQEVRAGELAERATEEAAKQAVAEGAAKQAADEAAKQAAKAAPWDKLAAWLEANAWLLALIIVVPLLLAGGLLWKRRRDLGRVVDWRAAGVGPMRRETTRDSRQAAALRNPPAGVVMPGGEGATQPPKTMPRADLRTPPEWPKPPAKTDTPSPGSAPARTASAAGARADALAVSELLQVTEEARVFMALGHTDRALEVLNEHIRQKPRPMPAAWMMLLDLYHATGHRQEFRRLAEDFHRKCNVQTPTWERFAAREPGDQGLDAFPAILKQVVAVWRRTGCRELLEQLLHDNGDGRRAGFPLAAYADILMLLQILEAPPAVDIDSDLANAGKLGPMPPRVGAPTAPAKPPGATEPADRTQAPKPMPPVPSMARSQRRPTEFELDLGEESRSRGKKPLP